MKNKMDDTNKQKEEIPNCLNCRKPMECTRRYSFGSDWECKPCGTWQRKLIPIDKRS